MTAVTLCQMEVQSPGDTGNESQSLSLLLSLTWRKSSALSGSLLHGHGDYFIAHSCLYRVESPIQSVFQQNPNKYILSSAYCTSSRRWVGHSAHHGDSTHKISAQLPGRSPSSFPHSPISVISILTNIVSEIIVYLLMSIELKAKHIKVLKLVYTVVENNPREGLRYSGKT